MNIWGNPVQVHMGWAILLYIYGNFTNISLLIWQFKYPPNKLKNPGGTWCYVEGVSACSVPRWWPCVLPCAGGWRGENAGWWEGEGLPLRRRVGGGACSASHPPSPPLNPGRPPHMNLGRSVGRWTEVSGGWYWEIDDSWTEMIRQWGQEWWSDKKKKKTWMWSSSISARRKSTGEQKWV